MHLQRAWRNAPTLTNFMTIPLTLSSPVKVVDL